jgi:site-specific DNA-adenine methylase
MQAPFPYFGGKRRAAPIIWQAFGDPGGYVEPFAGSAAVLLARPAFIGRRVETINDADGWLINAWRAIRHAPDAVAKHAHGPVSEIDYHARLAWLQARRDDELVAWLEGDPEHYDAKAAGWWLYVVACGIGDPWGRGPWRVVNGKLRKLPHLNNAGRGINRELPHLGDAGQGINRELPHLGDAGQSLAGYLYRIAERFRRVRITCGEWRRVLAPGVLRATTGGDGSTAVLLDPPYATSGDLYAHGSSTASDDARAWCLTAPSALRVVLCGYDNEHDELLRHGWRKQQGRAGGGAGYSVNRDNGKRERLWMSPACLDDTLSLGLT